MDEGRVPFFLANPNFETDRKADAFSFFKIEFLKKKSEIIRVLDIDVRDLVCNGVSCLIRGWSSGRMC